MAITPEELNNNAKDEVESVEVPKEASESKSAESSVSAAQVILSITYHYENGSINL